MEYTYPSAVRDKIVHALETAYALTDARVTAERAHEVAISALDALQALDRSEVS